MRQFSGALSEMDWRLGLSSWIIQDGNYGDFAPGDRVEAAVEFGFDERLELAESSAPSARHVDGSTYEVIGRVVLIEADVWVIDVGLCVFNEHKPPQGLAVGDVVAGDAYLGVDPFFYFERLGKRPSMPPLIYTWQVLEIARQTAPFISAGPRLLVRDSSRLGWEGIERTDAWSDDGGSAEYVLRCALLPEVPKRARGVST
jgi:hypothetical protein